MGSPKGNIQAWLNRLCEKSIQGRKGCLLTNTAVELAPHDPEMASLVRKKLARVETTLRQTLGLAVEQGELKTGTDVGALATFLFGTAQGLMVMGRLGLSRTKLVQHTKVALAALENIAE